MNVIIIEDEQHTAVRLKKMLIDLFPEISVLAILDSVESSIQWLKKFPQPDLIFQDIHLADGSGFDIYNTLKVECPVIFTTAFDQYAIEAFSVNSVDYLLKPVNKEKLEIAVNKYKQVHDKPDHLGIDYKALARAIQKKEYHRRFIIRYGQKIKTVEVEDCAYFFTESGSIFLKTFTKDTYPLDLSLDKLEPQLDPALFYRINRQFIINFKAIKEMYSYSKSRVKVELEPPSEYETIASTDRSGDFKKWLAGK